MLPLLQLESYNAFHVNATSSGVITYVQDTYDVTIKILVSTSNLWDGLFLEIKHENLKNKIIVGNIYKPPKDNNNCDTINGFVS